MTEHDQNAFEAALQFDLAAARQQIAAVTDQLRAAEARNEAQAHRIDWLTAEVARVTASREQYERVGIRASAMLEGGTSMMIKLLQDLQGEIKSAAFAKVPGKVADAPEADSQPEKPASEVVAGTGPEVRNLTQFLNHVDRNEIDGSVNSVKPSSDHSELIEALQTMRRDHVMRRNLAVGNSASLLPAPRLGNGEVK